MSSKTTFDINLDVYTLEFFQRVTGKKYRRWEEVPKNELLLNLKTMIVALNSMFPESEFDAIIGDKYGQQSPTH